jgi:signal transduction histidine kinase
MTPTSLTRRIFRIIFAIGAINVIVTMIAIEYIYEDVEETILSLELAEERAFIERRIVDARVQTWNTALLSAVYVPDGHETDDVPPLFAGRSVPFSAEVIDGSKSYLISVERTTRPPGVLYLAQDISLLEDREDFMQVAIALLCAGMLLLGLLLARQGTQRVVRPLHTLTGDIRRIEPGSQINRIESAYGDLELAEIASTLNELLGALDEYIRREKSLVSLASHELRTPLAVIAGALDVLEHRNSLGDADRRTLTRIRRATDEMRCDVDVLLKLARRNSGNDDSGPIDLVLCVGEVIADLEAFSPDTSRRIICMPPTPPERLIADRALVRMLLRNLIQNAVRHTREQVEITIEPERMIIRDHGEGLSSEARARLGEPSSRQSVPEGGLGLFIVRLICERLGWRIIADDSGLSGTVIELRFDDGAANPQTPHP